jgi:protein required for attachment to host cells
MSDPATTWILIADGSRARLFANQGRGTGLKPALDQEFIGVNRPSREIGSDQPGRAFDSAGFGRHAMEPPTDPHRYEKQRFANAIAGILDDARSKGVFDRLVVVAPPQALGDLRSQLSEGLRKVVAAELAKDLTKVPVHQLADHLREIVAL